VKKKNIDKAPSQKALAMQNIRDFGRKEIQSAKVFFYLAFADCE